MICIWCLNDFPKLSLEHGIPEALGCPVGEALGNKTGGRDSKRSKAFLTSVVALGAIVAQ